MSDFYYEARDESGKPLAGRIRAMSVNDAIRQLEANRWEVLSVRTVPREEREYEPQTDSRFDAGLEMPPLSHKESVEFASHLADVMQAGLPLVPGLAALARELPDGRVRRGLRVMVAQLEAGRSLETVLESRHVPADLRGLVKAGLRTGHTGEVLAQYVNHTQKMHELRRLVGLAWGYPFLLLMCAGLIFLFFLWYLVPQFAKVLEDFGTELPWITLSIISLSKTLHNYWPYILGGLFGGLLLLWMYWRFGLGAAQRRRVLWCMPVFGNLIRSAGLARFTRLLGLLLDSEVPLPEALRLAGQGAADAELGEAALYLADVVDSGRPLTGTEHICRRFPATFVQLLATIEGHQPKADAINALADACSSTARMFESQARVSAARIAAICHPLVAVFTGIAMGYLVLSMFTPLIKLMNDLS